MKAPIRNWATSEPTKRYLPMEHIGIEYTVVQTANPTGWKWTVQLPRHKPKTGSAPSRALAIIAAKLAIEHAIKVPRTQQPTKQ